jgi:hypothetical protein
MAAIVLQRTGVRAVAMVQALSRQCPNVSRLRLREPLHDRAAIPKAEAENSKKSTLPFSAALETSGQLLKYDWYGR